MSDDEDDDSSETFDDNSSESFEIERNTFSVDILEHVRSDIQLIEQL